MEFPEIAPSEVLATVLEAWRGAEVFGLSRQAEAVMVENVAEGQLASRTRYEVDRVPSSGKDHPWRADFEALLSDIDYPMFIVTAHDGVRRAGCLVGFATQASIDPPRLLVLLSHKNDTFRVASGATSLVVHFLADADRELANLFGEESGDWTDKFDACEWTPSDDGTPILSEVGGWIAGRIVERMDCGDHTAHLLAPTDASRSERSTGLTFQQVRDMQPGHDA